MGNDVMIRSLVRRVLGASEEKPARVPNPIEPWTTDPPFVALAREVGPRTLVDPARLWVLRGFALHAAGIAGEVAEVGVYKGGTARLLLETLGQSGKPVHLFDTFAGMPEADAGRDWHRQGDFADTSLESVRAYLGGYPAARFHPGLFPATAGGLGGSRFSFVHVDCDLHRSVVDCCEFFWPRLERGGVMVFDDYGFLTCPGARQAVDEFFAGVPEAPIYLPTGQAVAIKR